MSNLVRLLLALTVLLISVVSTTFFLNHLGHFNLAEIDLVIAGEDTPKLVKHWHKEVTSELESLRGQSLWKVSLKQIRDSMAAKSWVESVVVGKKWWKRIRVEIIPKKISFLLLNQGNITAVFADASMTQDLPMQLLPSRPIARDDLFARDQNLRKEMIEILQLLPLKGVLSSEQINEVSWSAFDGFTLSVTSPSTKVLLGTGNMKKKLSRVSRVLKYLIANQQTGRVIDAAYSQKVLVRLRNGP